MSSRKLFFRQSAPPFPAMAGINPYRAGVQFWHSYRVAVVRRTNARTGGHWQIYDSSVVSDLTLAWRACGTAEANVKIYHTVGLMLATIL
jgi:hypothetical protein